MSIQENIGNYYEKRVADALAIQLKDSDLDVERLADIACVALNHLPPRYFRHEIDMAFYLSPSEFQEMKTKVDKAIADAISYVVESHREDLS